MSADVPALEQAALRAGARPATARALARGAALHHAGQHFEAHEAWEEAWLAESGAARELLQGVIQLAAACHKAFVQGSANGCVRLCTSALEKLAPLPDGTLGVALAPLLARAHAFLDAAGAWAEGGPRPDPALAPRLEPR